MSKGQYGRIKNNKIIVFQSVIYIFPKTQHFMVIF